MPTENEIKAELMQRGRKSRITAKFIQDAFLLARRGCTNEEIFTTLDMTKTNFYLNLAKKPALRDALDRGRHECIAEVENAMFKAAIGYEVENVTTIIKDNDGKQIKEVKKEKKHVAPNVAAQTFILKNRKSDKWNDRRDVEHTGNVNVTHAASKIVFSGIDDDDDDDDEMQPEQEPDTENE